MESRGLIVDQWRNACTPPDRRPIHEWAEEHISLPSAYAIKGRFHADTSRHFLPIFDALKSETVRAVWVDKPIRGGGTMIADIWAAWCIVNDPGPLLWVMQTEKIASDHAETRLTPIFEACEAVRNLFPEDTNKKRKIDILFANGMPFFVRGPATSNLQSKGIRYLFCDEHWLWAHNHKEAVARTKDFAQISQNSKIYNCSQGGKENDPGDVGFQSGSMDEWTIPCLSCGHWMLANRWQLFRDDGSRWGITFDIEKEGARTNVRRACESVRFVCEKCGHAHSDSDRTRREWNRLGRYRQTNPTAPPSIKSFHWGSWIFRDWSGLVADWLEARAALRSGNIDMLRQFVQKEEARPWRESMLTDGDPLPEAAYEVKSDWQEEAFRFMTVDKQDEGVFYFVVRAWAKDGESRRLDFGKLYSYHEIVAKSEEWKVAPHRIMIDSGFEAKEVYFQCCLYGWNAVKGDRREYFVAKTKKGSVRMSYLLTKGDPERGSANQRKRFCPLFMVSRPTLQGRLQRLIDGKGAAWLKTKTHDEETEREYDKHLRSVYKQRSQDKDGTWRITWVCPSGNDHYRDCEYYQVALATMAKVLQDYFDEEK